MEIRNFIGVILFGNMRREEVTMQVRKIISKFKKQIKIFKK